MVVENMKTLGIAQNLSYIYIYVLLASDYEWLLSPPHQPMLNEVLRDRAHVVHER